MMVSLLSSDLLTLEPPFFMLQVVDSSAESQNVLALKSNKEPEGPAQNRLSGLVDIQ
jgi:hypothetical protein